MTISSSEKLCTKCKKTKSRDDDFHRNKSRPDGLCSWCKVCNCEYAKTLDKAVLRERHRIARKNNPRQYQREIYNNARRRARDCEVPFDLDPYTIPMPPSACPCCGRALIRKGPWVNQPSLDRLIPEKGYVLTNLQWLCRRCNQIKNNATLEELVRIVAYLTHPESLAESLDTPPPSV